MTRAQREKRLIRGFKESLGKFLIQQFDPVADAGIIRKLQAAYGLTFREWEVITLAADGLADKEIAERLKISIWTVRAHLKRVYQKTGNHSRAGAAHRVEGW